MKVLWFEVTTPGVYKGEGALIGGWQDSLERIVRNCPNIELTISFRSEMPNAAPKLIGNVNYIPMNLDFSLLEKIKKRLSPNIEIKKIVDQMRQIVETVNPDIVHVFGTEWLYGLIAKFTHVPVVIHIMGSLVPYQNALYPPFFSYKDLFLAYDYGKPKECIDSILNYFKGRNGDLRELEVWKSVKYYMGRTEWDRALSKILHPGRIYFHVDEAMRELFLSRNFKWHGDNNKRCILISTGCSSFWKGPDMLLKVAHILTELNFDFEWRVAGYMSPILKKAVEKKLKMSFKDNHVQFLGYTKQDALIQMLCESTLYVHTAYIENSPNSICEAQCLGVPIISTNVGGVSSLVKNKEQGVLVPANDPWQMANAIIELAADSERMQLYSNNNIKVAMDRHNEKNILRDLLNCYQMILKSK